VPFSAPDAVACKTRPRISGNRASAVGCGRKSLLVFTCTSAASAFSGARKLLIQSVPSSTVRSAALGLGGSIRHSERALQHNFPALRDRVLLLPCHPAAPS